MKFRKKFKSNEIQINGIWYKLCACVNCKKVHAFSLNLKEGLDKIDKKIKCCKKPNNWVEMAGTGDIIKEFIEEWQ